MLSLVTSETAIYIVGREKNLYGCRITILRPKMFPARVLTYLSSGCISPQLLCKNLV